MRDEQLIQLHACQQRARLLESMVHGAPCMICKSTLHTVTQHVSGNRLSGKAVDNSSTCQARMFKHRVAVWARRARGCRP